MSNPNFLDTKPIQLKVVLLGEAAVGKSSIVQRFVKQEFTEGKEPTIGGTSSPYQVQPIHASYIYIDAADITNNSPSGIPHIPSACWRKIYEI